jgi:hypothetical protein
MGKPMKSRILSTALALSLLGTVFFAFPVNASVIYTGSVVTTDDAGLAKDTFFVGDPVYVNVELRNDLGPYSGSVYVELVTTTDGGTVYSFTRTTNNPVVGWYNSSGTGWALWTNDVFIDSGFEGDIITCDVIVSYGGTEFARHSITVQDTGLTLDPEETTTYYPGQTISITLVTENVAEGFYVQIVNDTGVTKFNITNQVTWTGQWNYLWTIASDFPDGHFTMNVNDATTHNNWESKGLWVQKYELRVSSDRSYYLIGETAKINYAVFDASLGTPYGGVVISYSATWKDLVGNWTWQNDTLPFTSGTQDFLLGPTVNLSANVGITYWANETGTDRSYQAHLTLSTGLLWGSVSVSSGPYMPGDLVAVTVGAWAGGSTWGSWLPGASVNLRIEQNGTSIAAYGAANMTTDITGSVTHTFRLETSAMQGSYIVNVTIAKQGQSISRTGVFEVEWKGDLLMSFDRGTYYGGDTMVVTFRTIWNGQEITGLSISYRATVSYGVLTTGNTTADETDIAIPDDYYGLITVESSANINGRIFEKTASTWVYIASIVLTTDQDNYRQGDTIVFNFNIVTALTEGNLMYEITDHEGVMVKTGTPDFATSGSFSYDVPSENPSISYTAMMVMTTDAGSYLSASKTVTITENYEIQIWLGKSGYATGEFKPGQTVKVHYTINAYALQLPLYKIVLNSNLDPVPQVYLVTETSGTLDYAVPAHAPSMFVMMDATLRNGLTNGFLTDTSEGSTVFMVNSELGAWDKSVGGMSAINFLLLVLIIIMMLLLIIVPFLKGKMGGQKAAPAPPPVSPPPSP